VSERAELVVVGAGGSGLTAAVRAHDLGLKVAVVEALDRVGGATAFSGGQVWVGANHRMAERGLADSVAEAREYVYAIADQRGGIDAPVAEQWLAEAPRVARALEQAGAADWQIIERYADYYYPEAPGSKEVGRYLTGAPFDGSLLGEHRSSLVVTPHFPVGVTYEELFAGAADKERLGRLVRERAVSDVLTFGTGIAARLLLATLRRGITVLTSHRAVELIRKGDGLTGVVCETEDGRVELPGSVLLATSTYDWDDELVQEYSWFEPGEAASVAPPSLRGDGIRLARAAGARIHAVPADASPHVPGYQTGTTGPYDNGFRHPGELALPHCFLVNRAGRRFCDDSFHRAIARGVLGEPGNRPFFMIWDEQHHRKYGLNPAPPGAPYPDRLGVVSAPTLPELGAALGIAGERLAETAATFSEHAREGRDPEFGRGGRAFLRMFRGDQAHSPNPLLGPVEEPPFHGLRLQLIGTAIGAAGVHTGLHGQALDDDGEPIPGLYAAGAAAANTTSGTGYNSGFSLSRALTFGYLAAEHVAATATRRPFAAAEEA
jgi:3-oxosteroid 1-dehydrogenase